MHLNRRFELRTLSTIAANHLRGSLRPQARRLSPNPANFPLTSHFSRTPFSGCASSCSPDHQLLHTNTLLLSTQIAAMLPRAARSSCLRPARYALPSYSSRLPCTRLHVAQHRSFTAGPTLRKTPVDNTTSSIEKKDASPLPLSSQPQATNASRVPNPESDKANAAPKKEPLSETAKANKEQRKADWAIMREMAKYLWPKVRRNGISTFDRKIDQARL